MTHYFFSEVKPEQYNIAKMDDDFEVLDTYIIINSQYHKVCNCPAYRPNCKHFRFLEAWLEHPIEVRAQLHYNDETDRWELPPEGLDLSDKDHKRIQAYVNSIIGD